MGACMSSKMGGDDPVSRCRARKQFMKQAVLQRHAFATAHFEYLRALRNTGAALRQFGEGEGGAPAAGLGPYAVMPPPPRPPPLAISDATMYTDIDSPASSPSRELENQQNNASEKVEERKDEVVDADDTDNDNLMLRLANINQKQKDLAEMMKDLDEEFLKASAGAVDVNRFLEPSISGVDEETPRSKFWNYRSSKVFSSLSWNLSRNSNPFTISKEQLQRNVDESGRNLSHTLTLERLLAWEKKLLGEVKVVESLRAEQEKQCSVLRRQETTGEDCVEIEKTRAEIKRLHSLIVVSNQSVDSTVEGIEDLRDDELQPQLATLIDSLMHMWITMHQCHARQSQIIVGIKELDAMTQEATSDKHHQTTSQLQKELVAWHSAFNKLVASQRGHMSALYEWLKLSVLPLKNIRDKRKAMEEEVNREEPELLRMCEEWHRVLVCLPDKVVSEAIRSLSEVVKAMESKQIEEIKQRKKVEKMEQQWEKKARSLQPLEEQEEEMKNSRGRFHNRSIVDDDDDDLEYKEEAEEENSKGSFMMPIGLMERRTSVAVLKKKLESEMAKHRQAVQDSRVLTMNNLQTALPAVLEAMTTFSALCSQGFQNLHSLAKYSQSAITACNHD